MGGEPNRQASRAGAGAAVLLALALTLALGGCGSVSTSNMFGSINIFDSSKATTGEDANASVTDVECPAVTVRNGAATLLVGGKPGDSEPAALDIRYQGSIIRTARECHVNAGVMTMKVGIEGRVITGPAGGPGTVDVPLRIAVVHEGINSRTVVSKLSHEQVIVNNAIDRVTFTHVDSDISFPMPPQAADVESYVVYVGFDPQGAPKPAIKKKPAPKRKTPAAKPRPGAQPPQS
jgi:hypothetical protein